MTCTALAGLDALAVDAPDEPPELRRTTVDQRDTEPAARAQGEGARLARRAKEGRVRQGGPPPAFMPKGERPLAAEGEARDNFVPGQPGAGADGDAPPQGNHRPLPPAFVEYPAGDPRRQGVDDAILCGVQPHLLAASTPRFRDNLQAEQAYQTAPLRLRGGAGTPPRDPSGSPPEGGDEEGSEAGDSSSSEEGEEESAAAATSAAAGTATTSPTTTAALGTLSGVGVNTRPQDQELNSYLRNRRAPAALTDQERSQTDNPATLPVVPA